MSPLTSVISARASHRITENGLSRYDVTVQPPESSALEFFFEIGGAVIPPRVRRDDFLAVALVQFAMRRGCDLHIDGAVSRQLLVNLEEFQRAWSFWVPKVYRPIRITAREELPDDAPPVDRVAVVAFSGGVDATFAIARQLSGPPARDRCRIATAVLVHGFDIYLKHDVAFRQACDNAREMTAALNVPLSTVRTNWRELPGNKFWEHEFGAGLTACLSLFSEVANIGLMAADGDYGHFTVPWGSNPVTNHLLSSATFQNFTEGGAFLRTEKVRVIATLPDLSERLRVCWRGPQTGKNCGRCEKCMRTKLNFLANDLPVPKSLGDAPSSLDILRLTADNAAQIGYLEDILKHARRSSMSNSMRDAIWLTILKNRMRLRFPTLHRSFRVLTWPWRAVRQRIGNGYERV
jgi:7-cyano-7-deazaguanine synthase in queuosine biosynthesis